MVALAGLAGDVSSGAGLYGGIQRGGAAGTAQATLSGARLASGSGLLPSGVSQPLGGVANLAGSVLGIYTGLASGTAAGDVQAGIGAAKLGVAAGAASGALSGAEAGAAGSVLNDIAAPLALYNFAKSYQSGATGLDALSGAEAGAAVGSVVVPVPLVGTAIGAVIGGVVGAVSSAFGGGKNDPETLNWNAAVPQLAKNPALASQLSAPQAYQLLAGLLDAKNNSPGHSTQLELVFGRAGEGNLLTQMTQQINSAIASGAIPSSASASQIYSQVVTPWLQSKGAYVPPTQIVSSNGTQAGQSVNAILTQLISQWQTGQLTSSTPIGVSGQTDATIPKFAALGTGTPAASAPATPSVQVKGNTAQNTPQPGATMAAGELNSSASALTGGSPYAVGGLAPVTTLPTGGINTSGGSSLATEAGIAGLGAVASLPQTSTALNNLGVPSGVSGALPYLAAGGLGLYQAGQATAQNQSNVNTLSSLGAPLTAAGNELLNAGLTGTLTPANANVVSTLNAQGQTLIDSASPLASIANQAFANYSAGQLQPGQQQQIDAFTTSAKQQLAQTLANSGIQDSTILASQNAAIDSQAQQLTANLQAQNLNLGDQQYAQWLTSTQAGLNLQAQGAQYAAQSINTMLGQALQFSQAGMQPIEQAVQTAINGDAATSSNLSSLLQTLAGAYAVSNAPSAAAGSDNGIPAGQTTVLNSLGGSSPFTLPSLSDISSAAGLDSTGGVDTSTFQSSFFDPSSITLPNIDFGSGS